MKAFRSSEYTAETHVAVRPPAVCVYFCECMCDLLQCSEFKASVKAASQEFHSSHHPIYTEQTYTSASALCRNLCHNRNPILTLRCNLLPGVHLPRNATARRVDA